MVNHIGLKLRDDRPLFPDEAKALRAERDDLLAALKAFVEYEIYHGGQHIDSEPHGTFSTYGDVQETELACTGCNAVGVKRWRNNWKNEFTHEPGCRWTAMVETCKKHSIDLRLRT